MDGDLAIPAFLDRRPAPSLPATVEASASLARYDAMCRAIDAAYAVDEVKDIRDMALAFEAYAKQAKNTEAERRACEIRLRAERKAGQLLQSMEIKPGRPEKLSTATTISDLGISRDQSSKWQQLAAVPERDFEAALAAPEKPSTSGIIRKPKQEPMDPKALWLWGRLRDFENMGILSEDPHDVLAEMTDAMRADVQRLLPSVSRWLMGATDGDR